MIPLSSEYIFEKTLQLSGVINTYKSQGSNRAARVKRDSENNESPIKSLPFSSTEISWILRKIADTADEFDRYNLFFVYFDIYSAFNSGSDQ